MAETTAEKTRLITARKLRRMTQSALAAKAEISASYLAELEKTNDPPSPDVQQRLARVLKFDASELWPTQPTSAAS